MSLTPFPARSLLASLHGDTESGERPESLKV
jgi:hypothetical protein